MKNLIVCLFVFFFSVDAEMKYNPNLLRSEVGVVTSRIHNNLKVEKSEIRGYINILDIRDETAPCLKSTFGKEEWFQNRVREALEFKNQYMDDFANKSQEVFLSSAAEKLRAAVHLVLDKVIEEYGDYISELDEMNKQDDGTSISDIEELLDVPMVENPEK